MSNIDRFQEINRIRKYANDEANAAFLFKSANSTIICGEKHIAAAVVNEQEKFGAYIYTHVGDELAIGSVWNVKGLNFLITKEIITIKNVRWHKYAAELCNVTVGAYCGRFIGSGMKYVGLTLELEVMLGSKQQATLILPSAAKLAFGDKVVVGDRPWLVVEYDNLTTPGITYCYIEPTTKSSGAQNNSIIKEENSKFTVRAWEPITLATENGYFKYDKGIQIVAHSATSVTFEIPFGCGELQVKVKENGQEVTKTYINQL